MKYTILSVILVSFTWLLSACHSGKDGGPDGGAYDVMTTFDVDSTVVLDNLVLYTDNHAVLRADSLLLSSDHSFSHEGHTSGIDELYLCSDGGELCRFYAAEGSRVDISLQTEGDSLVVRFASEDQDSINPWLTHQLDHMKTMKSKEAHAYLDSLCHQFPADVRTTLLLRETIDLGRDSIFVRRCLGALTDQAKPKWLVKSIDQLLSLTSDFLLRNKRLTGCKFSTDSIDYDLSASRSDYLLIYFWSDYSQTSIDSLQALSDLVTKEYDMKRLKLLSCCLSAPDSLWWRDKIKDIGGMHVWLPAGFSDKRIYAWHIDQIPGLILCDMYNNQQQRNVWGKKLRDAIERIPNRSGFSHTNTKKANGRPNNLRRPARH